MTKEDFSNNVKFIRKMYGADLWMAKKAVLYRIEHPDCTYEGYVKASTLAVDTKCSFDERVKFFSKIGNESEKDIEEDNNGIPR